MLIGFKKADPIGRLVLCYHTGSFYISQGWSCHATIAVMTNVKRLLEQFKPTNYDIKLKIMPADMKFSGQVIIIGQKNGSSNEISLHSKDLKITSAKINGTEVKFSHLSQDELRLKANDELKAGNYKLELEFRADITETMHGIYIAPYSEGGVEKSMIATQLESHHAREAFPCVDEPMAKATFDLSISYPNEFTALSNMPVTSSTENGKFETTSFDTTPIMSTYLLAFAIGDLVSVSTKTKRGIDLKVWSTPEHAGHLDFALGTGKRGLDFFEDYFGIDYPLPKCDFVAIPSFSAGAMENWGLITYRESALFVDENNTRLSSKQRIAETIIHELAHQWFGNLVTMEWWEDLWLNEGFASWAANFGVDKLFPEWQYWSQFIASDFSATQLADCVPSSRPIEVKIDDPEEIRSLFDEISYSKGPVIVRMLQQFLGEKDFQTGISYYLNKHSYANATTADLWSALEEKSGKPVTKFMSSWTSQAGYPYVQLEVKGDKVRLEQNRFLITGSDVEKTWPIPISHTETNETFLLDAKTETWNTDVSGFPKFNADQGGLYMVAYPEDYLEVLKQKVISQELGVVERLGLTDDIFQLAKGGHGSITDALDLMFKLGDEESLVVWEAIAGQISSVRRIMEDEELIENMRPFVMKLVKHNLERLGWEPKRDESSFDTIMRPMILGLAGFGDDKSVTDKAISMFEQANKPEDIAPNLRGVVYGLAVRHGDQTTFDKLLDFYRTTSSPQEKQSLAGAITGFKQPEIIQQALELIKSEVKLQDAGFWLANGFSNRYAKQQMWDWVKANWNWILSKFEHDIMTLSWIPEYASFSFATQEFLDDYKAFWELNSRKSIERDINKGIENLTWQIDWRNRDFAEVQKYFKKA